MLVYPWHMWLHYIYYVALLFSYISAVRELVSVQMSTHAHKISPATYYSVYRRVFFLFVIFIYIYWARQKHTAV
jgi:hypothetical protein